MRIAVLVSLAVVAGATTALVATALRIRWRLRTVPGIGSARRKALLAHFGGYRAVSRASSEDVRASGLLPEAVVEAFAERFE